MPTLNWAGKDKVARLDVPPRVLRRKWTFGEDPGNMVIHGDNLEALKALLPRYEGRVQCIYIDPPYNTGNEGWVYNDNVNDPQLKRWFGQVVGKEGEDFSRHDKWLCMMYPRLKLLRKLLAQDGAIFISIDDNEQANLKLVCDEIFGASNFIASLIWRKADSPSSNTVSLISDHEYVLVYAKDGQQLKLHPMEAPDIVDAYGIIDEMGRRCRDRLLKKNGRSSLRKDRPSMFFPIIAPDGTEVLPIHDNGEEARWAMGKDGVAKLMAENRIVWKRRQKMGKEVWEPYTREYAPDNPTRPYPTIWGNLHTMRQAKAQLREIFATADLFDTPKPVNLIEQVLRLFGDKEALVLDSFAGSGTTAHAVLNANAADCGKRRFILVESMDYAEGVTAERVKRVIGGYGAGDKAVEGTGGGFEFLELGPAVFGEDGELNGELSEEELREWVWELETRENCGPVAKVEEGGEKYFLGMAEGRAVYFCHERGREMVLDGELLQSFGPKAKGCVVYAHACLLEEEELREMDIAFRKVPRDLR